MSIIHCQSFSTLQSAKLFYLPVQNTHTHSIFTYKNTVFLLLFLTHTHEWLYFVVGTLRMSQKRQQGEEGTSFDDKRSKKSPSFRRLVLKVMKLQRLQNLITPVVEPLLRRVVNEEVDSALRNYIINMERGDILPSESRILWLRFSNAISQPVFTKTAIQGEGCADIEVALVDASTGQVVSSGPGSSANVEIVVLEGDFGGDGGENWTPEEFKRNIVRERKGKKPLLAKAVILTLKDGKGLVGNVSFTDNSSWIRSRKFRLGARLMDDIDGIKVREARSEAFIVRNHLRNSCTKHHPPSLSHEVWRLKNIRKDGPFHKSLSRERVNNVQEFLVLLNLDPRRLRNIIGTTMSKKKWEATVEHARTCVLDKSLYLYTDPTSPQTKGVYFNVVGEVMGMFKDGQYVTTANLSNAEKEHARELVISAHEHRDKILTLNDETSPNPPPSSLPSSSTDHQDLSPHNIARSTYSQLQDASSPDFMPLFCSNIGGSPSFTSFLHNLEDTSYDQSLSFLNPLSDTLVNQRFNYSEEDATIDAFNPFSTVRINKAQRWWDVLLSVLRWKSSIKRIMARKTHAIQEQDDDVRARISSF